MDKKTSVGEWVVISLSIIYVVISTVISIFSKPINESVYFIAGAFILPFFASLIGALILFYIIYLIITKLFPNSKDWGVILWILAIVGIAFVARIILGLVAVFIFGRGG